MSARGSYAKGVAKREEILTAALDVVARNGYRGTSVRELADAVGLSQAGLLHYFSSKEALFVEILRKRDEVDRSTFLADPDQTLDAVEGLVRVVEHNTQVPGLVELYAQLSVDAADSDHPAHDFFRERYARLERGLAEAITRSQHGGAVRRDADPTVLARMLLSLTDGLQTRWLLDRDLDMTAAIRAWWALAHS